MTSVAVVGLGAMGALMARRLLEAGHELVVWNRDPAKVGPLTERGAIPAASPADAARRTEVAITMVADPAALRAVSEGPNGVVAGASASTPVIQMSTVGPAATARLASLLPPDGLLDAPVLGSLTEAEAGNLVVFAGGDERLVERWRPLLSALGTVVPVGPIGAGSAAKLVANTTLLGVLGVLGEAVALADGLGLPREVAFGILAATPLAAQAERRREALQTGRYPVRFTLSLARKDADLILDAARSSGLELGLTSAARAWFADAEEAGLGPDDYSAVLARIVGRG